MATCRVKIDTLRVGGCKMFRRMKTKEGADKNNDGLLVGRAYVA